MARFPEEYKFPFFCFAFWKRDCDSFCRGSGIWFRIFWGYGMYFGNGRKGFSERYGYEKRIPLPFGWRAKFLTPRTY
jgi:hypothetical protein